MSDRATPETDVELQYELDAPPEKVWRAISMPEFREQWLPTEALVDSDAALVKPGEELRYRMREDDHFAAESVVTFRIAPNREGGTRLSIIHERGSVRRTLSKADSPVLMLAA